MAGNSPVYPVEVWQALRQLWEATPKITWGELRENVSSMMRCECPSAQAISARSKREGWKKIPLRKRKHNPVDPVLKQMESPQQPLNTEGDCDASVSEILDNPSTQSQQRQRMLKTIPDPTPVLEEARRILSTVEKVVWGHRRRAAIIGNLMESVMNAMADLAETMPRPDLDDPEFEAKIERRSQVLKGLYAEMKLLELMAITAQVQQKAERESWGIEMSGDDGESEKRKASIAELESKTREARAGLQEQRAAVAERLRRIEEGEILIDAAADAA